MNCSAFVGFGASGPLAVNACSKPRKSSPVATGKKASELATTSSVSPSAGWNLIDMPWGLASGEPSGSVGIPVELENRTVTGTGLPAKITALLNPDAAGVAVKLPSTTTPLA